MIQCEGCLAEAASAAEADLTAAATHPELRLGHAFGVATHKPARHPAEVGPP